MRVGEAVHVCTAACPIPSGCLTVAMLLLLLHTLVVLGIPLHSHALRLDRNIMFKLSTNVV